MATRKTTKKRRGLGGGTYTPAHYFTSSGVRSATPQAKAWLNGAKGSAKAGLCDRAMRNLSHGSVAVGMIIAASRETGEALEATQPLQALVEGALETVVQHCGRRGR